MTHPNLARSAGARRTPPPTAPTAIAATEPAARASPKDPPSVRELLHMWFSGFD